MTYWTIETGGTEKSLFDWGISIDFSCSWTSKGRGTASLRTTERFDPVATQWAGPSIVAGLPVKQHAIIHRDRVSADGTPDSFSGGTIYFQGYFDVPQMVFDGGRENIHYQLHNV